MAVGNAKWKTDNGQPVNGTEGGGRKTQEQLAAGSEDESVESTQSVEW